MCAYGVWVLVILVKSDGIKSESALCSLFSSPEAIRGAVRVDRARQDVGLLVLGHCCQTGQDRHPAPHQGVAADHGAEAGATTVANWPALPCAVLIPICAPVQAALVPEGKPNGEPSVLSVQVGAQATKFVLCHLAPGKCEQWAMDLGFSADEEVTFFLTGKNQVHLTGFFEDDEEDDEGDFGDEDDSQDEDEEDEAPPAQPTGKAAKPAAAKKPSLVLDEAEEEEGDSEEEGEEEEGEEEEDDDEGEEEEGEEEEGEEEFDDELDMAEGEEVNPPTNAHPDL